MIKRYTLFLLLFVLISPAAFAQNDNIAPELSGNALIEFLEQNFSITQPQTYNAARDFMFNTLDVDGNGFVRGVYSGDLVQADGTRTPGGIFNTEHTWPQSFFNEILPLRSDIHHLFPTREDVNGARSNFPFAEIPDAQTSTWYRLGSSQSAIPVTSIDEYSELLANTSFEPREDHKGNVARSIFYFWTMYQNHSAIINDETNNAAFFEGMKTTLLQWHRLDPADSLEVARSLGVETLQGNRNPFIHDSSLVRRAFFEDGSGTGDGDGGASGSPSSNLIITGLFDGPLTGGTPKVIELFALSDVPDLSIYALGSANNGGGTDGPEFILSGSLSANEFLHIATEIPNFNSFFGFDPRFVDGAAPAINGDDAVELFVDSTGTFSGNEQVVDVFGEIDVDGSETAWDYLDGWAYRKNGTGPDSTLFNIDNWIFSGINAMDGETSNATSSTPFPISSYVGDISVSIDDEPAQIPRDITLSQNFPNPFNPVTNIQFELSNSGFVRLEVFDLLGRSVALLLNDVRSPGTHVIAFDASNQASGIYIYRLQVAGQVFTRKMTLLK